MSVNLQLINLSAVPDKLIDCWNKINNNFTTIQNKLNGYRHNTMLSIPDLYNIMRAVLNVSGTINVVKVQNYLTANNYYTSFATVEQFGELFNTLEPRFAGGTSISVVDLKIIHAVDNLTYAGTNYSTTELAEKVDNLTYPQVTSGTVILNNSKLSILRDYIAEFY